MRKLKGNPSTRERSMWLAEKRRKIINSVLIAAEAKGGGRRQKQRQENEKGEKVGVMRHKMAVVRERITDLVIHSAALFSHGTSHRNDQSLTN